MLYLFITLVIQEGTAQTTKINGVSFVASGKEVTKQNITPLIALNANYATVMPFGFIRNTSNPEIFFNSSQQWFGETKAGAKQYIQMLQKNRIKTMIKPQIWISRGAYTGFLKMENEADWKQLEASYTKFIITYAKLAQEIKADIFCIGTELEQFVAHRPEYWKALISKIKSIYKGKLTYASNWDEYKRTPFWKQLDYIGIDAYYPISDQETPTVEVCRAGWQQWKTQIQEIAEKNKRKVLFTEFGYRSVNYAAKEPWRSDRDMNDVNLEAQVNTTKALFEEFWKEEWFAGGFVWKWFIDNEKSGGIKNSRFTPQNKPAEKVIRTYFKNS